MNKIVDVYHKKFKLLENVFMAIEFNKILKILLNHKILEQ